MLDWDLWHTLLLVVRQGTYQGAGRVLKINPTTVGRKIKRLEQQLGYKLFVRTNGRLFPTGQCEALLPQLEQAASKLRQVGLENEQSEQGILWREVRITAPPFLVSRLLAPQLHNFSEEMKATVELLGTSNKQFLSRREADMALVIEDQPGTFWKEMELISAQQLEEIEYAVFCGLDERSDDLPWAGLVEGQGRDSGSEAQMRLSKGEGVRYRVQQFEALVEIVASRAAKALLPRFMVQGDQRLKFVSDTILRQPLWLLYHQQDEHTAYLSKVRNWVADSTKFKLNAEKSHG